MVRNDKMSKMHYTLKFDGFWLEANLRSIPSNKGIYCVHTCIFNAGSDSVSLQNLIDVAESNNIREDVTKTNKLILWKKQREDKNVEELCFSCAPIAQNVSEKNIDLIVKMIHAHSNLSSENATNQNDYDFNKIHLIIDGAKGKLPREIPKFQSTQKITLVSK